MSNESNESPAPEAATTKQSRVPVIIALVIGITLGGMGASLIVGPLGAEKSADACSCEGEKKTQRDTGAPKPLHTVGELVLNPASSGGTRFLMLSVAFSVNDAQVVQSMQDRDLEVRDKLLKVLGSKTVFELSDVGGRPELKDEVREQVGSLFGANAIHDVFFPHFVIQ